jgi:hypothetical protein
LYHKNWVNFSTLIIDYTLKQTYIIGLIIVITMGTKVNNKVDYKRELKICPLIKTFYIYFY